MSRRPRTAIFAPMLNVLSILVGLVALLFALPGIVPLLGILNWIAIPVGVVGAAIGGLSSKNAGRNFNLLILIVAVLRLMLGGGLF